ncbi:hypothetical protein RN001_014323 [Aquatica leii]|uniref:Regulatory protein zeste n=1 Tax=Aquatica leii TaxID=1421715 RepID=A0AAN7SLZ9_9COLE|nr:hypothetical protein RN001_014323 [Aquatica leii]
METVKGKGSRSKVKMSENAVVSKKKISSEQLQILIDFISTNKILLHGKTKPSEAASNEIENLWDELTTLLNSCGSGPSKLKSQWKKTFIDWKCHTRKKARDILQSMRKTGGGEGKEKVLTPTEEKLLSLISWVTIKGNEEVEEIGMVAEKEIETVAQPQFNLIPQTQPESLMEPQPDCLLEPQPDCLLESQPHHPEITKRKRSYTCVPSTSAQHEPRKKGVQIKQSESSLQKIVDTYAAAQRQTKEIAELLKLNVSEDFRNRELDLKEREIQVRIIEAQNKSKELVLRERELNIKERELSFKEIEYLEKNKIYKKIRVLSVSITPTYYRVNLPT